MLRDSKNPQGLVFYYSAKEWQEFTYAVKSGRFDSLR